MKKLFVLALFACGFAGSGFAAAFQNGDFELPAGSSTTLGANDPYVTGWIHNGTGLDIYTHTMDWGTPSYDGQYYVAFGHNSSTGGTLSQTFDTVAGDQYSIAFFVTLQQNTAPSNNVNLSAFDATNSNLLGSADTVISVNSWAAGNALTFTAASNSTKITFTDTTSAADSVPVNWGLDGVSATDLSLGAAAPEPMSFALLGAGLFGISVFRRKR